MTSDHYPDSNRKISIIKKYSSRYCNAISNGKPTAKDSRNSRKI